MIRLLLVDDENGFRNALAKLIRWEDYGYELIGMAANGRQGLEILKEKECDVVFTDIEMSGVDGIAFMDDLREKYPDIVIVVISCYNKFEYARAALQRGARDYITKLSITPASMGKLLLKLRSEIEESRKQDREKEMDKLHREIDRDLIQILGKEQTEHLCRTCINLPQHIREVLEYIYQNKKFELSLSDASEFVHLNPQYFSTLFKKNLGINYVQYMSRMRINYAKNLLVNTDMKIYEVGLKIGMENEAYVSRFFKKYTGESPVEYRVKSKKKTP